MDPCTSQTTRLFAVKQSVVEQCLQHIELAPVAVPATPRAAPSWPCSEATCIRYPVAAMGGDRAHIPLGWGGKQVALHSYVAFYYSTPEAVSRSLAFLRAGLDEPDTFCIFLAEDRRLESLLQSLDDGRSERVRERIEEGKLVAAPWHPNFEGLADTLMGRLDHALEQGYTLIRAMGLVDWDEVGWGDAAWLKRCERAINMAASMYPMVILCTYRMPELPQMMALELGDPEEPRIVVNDAMGSVKSTAARVAMSLSRKLPRRR